MQDAGTPGGGTDHAASSTSSMHFDGEIFLALGDPGKHHARYEAAMAVMVDQGARIIRILRAGGASEKDLMTQARNMYRGMEKRAHEAAFEEGLIERIIAGELFTSGSAKLVRAILQRLQDLANSPAPDPANTAVGIVPSKSKEAQEELAQITAQFISTKRIKEGQVWPWLSSIAETEGFQARWTRLFRQADKPHDRTQFEFCLGRLVTLDELMRKFSLEIGLPKLFSNVAEFNQAADVFIEEVETWSGVLARVLKRVLPWFEEATKEPHYDPNFDAWQLKRMGEPEQCIDAVLPFVMEEWIEFRKRNKARIPQARTSPANVSSRLRNCVSTIYHEFRSPPITRDAKDWIVPKHTGKTAL